MGLGLVSCCPFGVGLSGKCWLIDGMISLGLWGGAAGVKRLERCMELWLLS